jgi:RHS repeat-associated protein
LALFLFPDRARLAQKINGGSYQYLDTETIATTEDAWYDVRVVADGGNVTVWRGEKGGAMEKILETSSASITTTSYLRFENAPYSDYRVDDIRLIGGSLSNTTTAFTFDSGNELSTRTVNSITTHFTYDAWGRMASKYVADGVSASYAYRYGDTLYSVTSNFPGESSVSYDYGGDQKRRERTTSGTTPLTDLPAAFTGRPLDPASGLYSFPYRIYSPELARCLSRDPLGMVDGPNVYGYVTGNPSNCWDYDGQWLLMTAMVVIGLIVGLVGGCSCNRSDRMTYDDYVRQGRSF